eukprot:4491930-Lingulodinium_polyedra.AAC.1
MLPWANRHHVACGKPWARALASGQWLAIAKHCIANAWPRANAIAWPMPGHRLAMDGRPRRGFERPLGSRG